MGIEKSSNIGKIRFLMKKIHIHPAYLLIPITLSIISAGFEGVSMGLLIPILNGFFQKSFLFIQDIPVLGTVVSYFPEEVLQNDRMIFGVLLGGLVVIYIVKNVVRYLASISVICFSERAVHHLRKAIFTRYLTFGKQFFDTTTVGHHATVLMEFSRQALYPLITVDRYINSMFSLLVYFCIMMMISWKLTCVALPLFILLHFAVRFIVNRVRVLSRSISKRGSELGKKTVEILSTIPLVKSYSAENMEQYRYKEISLAKTKLDVKAGALNHLILPLQEVITMSFAALVFVGALWWFGRDQIASASALIVYFYIVMNASSKFGSISGFHGTLAAATGPLDEIMAIFSDEEKYFVEGGTEDFSGLKEGITFNHLTFAYTSDRPILEDVSFTIPKGKMTAIVGPTGSGKSTIINLLMRYYDCPPDAIFVDGRDVREFTLHSYLDHVAIVSQETLLLHESLKNNICYGLDREVPDKEIEEVVERARLGDFVRILPQGLETLIGDRGVKLSGGEKQRVSIARALLKGAEILILDEATSSLDSQTEKLIQEAIDEAVAGRTAIVIAHRLSTIRDADSILVIEDGRLVEEGKLEDLLDKKQKFYQLWEEQKF